MIAMKTIMLDTDAAADDDNDDDDNEKGKARGAPTAILYLRLGQQGTASAQGYQLVAQLLSP